MKLPSPVAASWQFTSPSALSSRRRLTAIRASRAPHSICLFFFLTERSSSSCHRPPRPLPRAPRPALPILRTLWCATSHLTLKAVKSQFSDKSNLNLSGDAIFRSDRDRAACVAIILYKHFEADATFVKSVSGAVLLDLPDKGNAGKWM